MIRRLKNAIPDDGTRRGLLGTLAYLALLGVLLAIAFVLETGEEVARGRFVDSVGHDVVRVEVLDRFTIYTDETLQPFSSDAATAFALLLISGMALLAYAVALRVAPGETRLHLFFILSAAGATLLAFDEHLELSETLSYNIEALYVPDIVVYVPPALVFAFFFRRILMSSRRALVALMIGGAIGVGAQALDRLPHDRFEGAEEKGEVVAAIVLGAGFLLLAVDLLAPAALSPSRRTEPTRTKTAPEAPPGAERHRLRQHSREHAAPTPR